MSRGRTSARLLVGIAVAAGAVVLAAGSLRAWLDRRAEARAATPVLEGRIEVEGAADTIEIWRDVTGWPRVLATNEADAWFGLGFVHAQDRLEQMLWLRRLALGRAAERLGEAGLPADRLARTLDFAGLGRDAAGHLAPEGAAVLEAYAAGVNARLARVVRQRPEAAGGDAREPWTPSDSLAIFKLVSWSSSQSTDMALVLSDLIQVLGGVGARPFFPARGSVRGVELPVDWPAAAESSPIDGGGEALRPALLDATRLDGSGWVIPPSGDRSAPILSAELTFGATAPALVHPALLSGGDLRVAGAAIPGLPIFWCGRNDRVAWAVAPSRAVATDLYTETLRPDDRAAYHDGSRWTALEERVVSIEVRGADPVELRVRGTHHGPLLDEILGPEREAFAVAWTGSRPGTGPEPLLALARVQTAEELELAIGHHRDPAIAVAYADRDGVRGARVVGWLPQRVLPSSGVPVPGRMRAFNWYEPVAFDRLPARRTDGRAARDAPPIFVADEALPEGRGPTRVEWLWRRGIRAARLGDRLARPDELVAASGVALHDTVQAGTDDVVSAIRTLAPQGAALGAGPAEMLELLSVWGGRFDRGAAGAVAYQTLLHHLVRALFEPALGPRLLERYRRLPGADPELVAAAILVAAARQDAPGSWADRSRVVPALSDALREAWVSIRFRLGPNRSRWRWGRLHQLVFRSFQRPDGGPVQGSRLGAPVAVAGSDYTLLRTESRPGSFDVERISGFQMRADLSVALSEADGFRSALAPGIPAQPAAPGFDLGLESWRRGDLARWPEHGDLEADRDVRRLALVPAS